MVAISKDYVASNALVDDDYDRVTLLVDQNKTLLNSILSISPHEELLTQHMKLDNLYLLVKLDRNIRCQIKPQFATFVCRVLSEIKLYETLEINNVITNVKYFKLLNKGIMISDLLGLEYTKIQFDFTYRFFLEILDNCDYMIPSDGNYATLIIEILKYFMFIKDQINGELLPIPLIQSLVKIIRRLSHKLNCTINYKYVTVSNISSHEHKYTQTEISYNITDNNIKDLITVPNPCVIENVYEIDAIQYSLAIISSKKKISDILNSILEDTDIKIFIQSLLKHSNINLKCAALKFFLYPYFNSTTSWRDTKTVRQILPFLLNTFDFKSIPWWFDPFDNLIKLIEVYNKKNARWEPCGDISEKVKFSAWFYGIIFH